MAKSKSGVTFGELIKKARKGIGLSQKELAKALHVSDKAVSAYEVNRAAPPFETIKKISQITKKPITYFDTGNDNLDDTIATKLESVENELKEIRKLLSGKKSAS